MEFQETFETIVCLVLPVVGLLVLFVGWLRGRRGESTRTFRPQQPAYRPGPQIVHTMTVATERVARTAQQVAQTAVQSIETSFVSQISLLYTLAIEAVGFVVARFHSDSGTPILQVNVGDKEVQVIDLRQGYQLDVAYQREVPPGYTGADVDLVEAGPVKLSVVVEGNGFEISGPGVDMLESDDGERAVQTSFQITPTKTGEADLHVEFYRGTNWVQRLDLNFTVRPDDLPGITAEPNEVAESLGGDATSTARDVAANLTVPPAVPQAIPPDLHLSFAYAPNRAAGHSYQARASVGDAWRKLDVTLREDDLAAINTGLTQALRDTMIYFADSVERSAEDIDSEAYFEILDQLARRGNAAFKRIFPDAADRDYITQALDQGPGGNLEISSDDFFLPWELLYDPYDEQNVHYENFWGFRYNISRVLTDIKQKASPLIAVKDQPRIVLFANSELPSVADHELPYFYQLGGEAKILLLDWLQKTSLDLESSSLREQRADFFKFSTLNSSDVTHFACHAVSDLNNDMGSYLELSSLLRIQLEDMLVADNYHLPGWPVVVLNACGTGVYDPRKSSDFVRQFMQFGARGVLATEYDVPDQFASLFIQRLYDLVLQGETFSGALMTTRQHYLREHGNPLGLLYSAYLALETRLVRDR